MRYVLLVALLIGNSTPRLWAAEPLIHQDFEKNESGWVAFGPATAKVHIAHEAGSVKNGDGSLELDYEASASQPAVAILPVPKTLAGARSFSFWIMADAPTAEALVLAEKGGARYAAVFWLNPHTWQRVELTPEDFVLGRNPGDPPDPDGQLDLDQVVAMSLVDISQIVNAAAGESGVSLAVVAHTGMHKLFVDDFEVGAEPPAGYKSRAAFTIDRFPHPQLNWFTLGGADLKLDATQKAIPGQALQADYEELPDHFVVISRLLPAMDLRGATHLDFDIVSERPAQFVVSLQEHLAGQREGPRYTAHIRVAGGGKLEHRQVALSGFEPDENGPKDPNGKLDLDQLKAITFVDITAAFTQESAVNTIRIANIEAVKTAALPQ